MGDFLLDLRPVSERRMDQAAERLRYFPDMNVQVLDRGAFSLALSSCDDSALWGPFFGTGGRLLVALAGRLAFDETDWRRADMLPGEGGAACRLVAARFRENGVRSLAALNGNFALIVHDSDAGRLHLVTDRWGAFPAFYGDSGGKQVVYGSHPDVLADVLGQESDLDQTSLAEFLVTGRVSFPFTYFRNIKALPNATVTTIELRPEAGLERCTARYVDFRFRGSDNVSESQLAEELAEAFRSSVRRRTLPRLGKSAIALSGGLDSRSILCAAPDRSSIVTFCSHDEVNYEYKIAERIAVAAGVPFFPFRRSFEFYGETAESGTRISGGMGCIACNHFLGFRKQLLEMGVRNLLTGCYCDYVFKGLVLNKASRGLLKREKFAPFQHECYEPLLWFDTPLAQKVRERLDSQFPPELREYRTEEDRWMVEQRRLFPLFYETDNAQRVVPQRVLGWYVPIADNDVFDTYLKVPCRFKLNRSLFQKVAKILCGKTISSIPDANTGAPVGAPEWQAFVSSKALSVERKLLKLRKTIATNQSWPNWELYAQQSQIVRNLWEKPNPNGWNLIREITGENGQVSDLNTYRGSRMALFHHVFSLKLWADSRKW